MGKVHQNGVLLKIYKKKFCILAGKQDKIESVEEDIKKNETKNDLSC